jgi:hypothetical protein
LSINLPGTGAINDVQRGIMAERTEAAGYTGTARSLHWLILLLLIIQFTIGWLMPDIKRDTPVTTLIGLHFSFGILILAIAIVRLGYRLSYGEPRPEDGIPPWQTTSARIIHWLLYLLLFVVPLTAFLVLCAAQRELSDSPESEGEELTQIYVERGIDRALAVQVAEELMAKDALKAHARDELGISEVTTARPIQAAFTSALTFAVGAALPLLMVIISPIGAIVPAVAVASLAFLALLGAVGAKAGGANIVKGMARVTFWGALAMGATAVIGKLFGNVV